mmetsp:Transcript_10805/g.16519  ORF Transcript_10805/g.16519 Transcript_10805/m.16519 type:complete len:211 (-) Transcript_10805:231-863(-)
MKRSSSPESDDMNSNTSRKRVRFCNDTELIENNTSDTDTTTSSSSSSIDDNCDAVLWYSKKELDVCRLAAIQVSFEAQQQLISRPTMQDSNLEDVLNNPLDITQQCDLLFKKKYGQQDETVRGLERLVNPSLGIKRKNQRQFVIRSVLIAQQLAKEQQQSQSSPDKNYNSNVDHLIAQFLQKETGPAKLIAHLVAKADQETANLPACEAH